MLYLIVRRFRHGLFLTYQHRMGCVASQGHLSRAVVEGNRNPVLHLIDVARAAGWSPVDQGLEGFAQTPSGLLNVIQCIRSRDLGRAPAPDLGPKSGPGRHVRGVWDGEDCNSRRITVVSGRGISVTENRNEKETHPRNPQRLPFPSQSLPPDAP